MKIKQINKIHALAQRVLAVAVVSIDEETKEIVDWTCYIDSVAGFNHEAEAQSVANLGDKHSQELACFLFPELDEEKYRR